MKLAAARPSISFQKMMVSPAFGTGWIPDPPDSRDYTVAHPRVGPTLDRLRVAAPVQPLPATADLSTFFPAVVDQGSLHSCTAATTAGLISYFQRKAYGRSLDASVFFLYKVARNLLGARGDSGAVLRTTMQGLRLFGAVPEFVWPSNAVDLDAEPQAFHYAYASNYKAKTYYRLDEPGLAADALLARVRTNLAAQLPSMFGFFVFPSIALAGADGAVPYPSRGETPTESHALVAVGYDDARTIRNPIDGSATVGALRVRNSWGAAWGDGGYGWFPYQGILGGLTSDWWSLIEAEFVDTGQFGLR
jgi:C1A family cysteine protease